MQKVVVRSGAWTAIWLAACLVASSAEPIGSGSVQRREHAVLLPAFGGTPASFQIEAQAKWLIAQGDLMESAAIARKIHAEAVAQEIDNWVKHVEAHFERRRIRDEAYWERHPNHWEREKRRQKLIQEQITEYGHQLKGDPSKYLNWLLAKLSAPMSYQYVSDDQGPADWPTDPGLRTALREKLTEADLPQIRFSAGGLEFPATEPKVLEIFWPPGLRGPEFESARTQYEKAREEALKQPGGGGQLSHENAEELFEAVNRLFVSLEGAYPLEARKREPSVSHTYHEAKSHVRSLLVQVHKAIRMNDPSVFDGTLCFQGGTIPELIQHMHQTGLEFAPPQGPGGDRVYKSLKDKMVEIYRMLGTE